MEKKPKRTIHLPSMLTKAKNNQYKSIEDIDEDFRKIEESIEHYRQKIYGAFHLSYSCSHSDFKEVIWYLSKNIVGYHYTFEKTCCNCGKKEYLTLLEWDEINYPEGFEGAKQVHRNLFI